MSAAEDHLAQLIAKYHAAKNTRWDRGKFVAIKSLSTTEKGNIAEDFAVWLAQHHGHQAKRHQSRRGEWDIKIADKTLEVKTATQDINGNFQFNGIRYDTKYDLLLVVGVLPDSVLFNIYPRKDLMDMPLVNMAKGTNATYKLTRQPSQLRPLSEFPDFFNGNSIS